MADFDTNQAMMAQWAARMASSQQQSGGDKQGPLDCPINKGAPSCSITPLGLAKGNLPALNGTGRGMCGSIPDKLMAALQAIGDGFLKSLSGPTGIQPPVDISPGSRFDPGFPISGNDSGQRTV